MKFQKICSFVVGATLLAAPAWAATEAGKIEVSGLFTYAHTWAEAGGDTMDFDEYVGTIGVGYFVTKPLEIKLNVAFIGFHGEGVDATAEAVMGGLDYHFLTDKSTVPYIGVYGGGIFANADLGAGDDSTSGWIVDGHVGLKQFVSDNVSIDLRISYQYSEIEDVNLNNMMAMVGINFLFN